MNVTKVADIPAEIMRGRESDDRVFKRFPHKASIVRRPFPGEAKALIEMAIAAGRTELKPYDPDSHYYVAVAKIGGSPRTEGMKIVFCEPCDEPVPPDFPDDMADQFLGHLLVKCGML